MGRLSASAWIVAFTLSGAADATAQEFAYTTLDVPGGTETNPTAIQRAR